uniref:Uncharacterized protein n=1 Tax=Hyaloperonospora arabidopsidis (strain Emoy2) TaxID=559515 RepID=M4BVY0_HYAAE
MVRLAVLVPREHSPLHSRQCAPTAWNHSPERHLELRERVRNAAPTNPARVETQASVCDTGARLVPRASRGTMMLRQWMYPCDQQYDLLSSAPGLPHRQAEVGPRGDNAGVLVSQEDVDEAVNRAVDAQLAAEAALEHAAQAETTASEILQSNRELRMRNLERQVHGMHRWERGRVRCHWCVEQDGMGGRLTSLAPYHRSQPVKSSRAIPLKPL